MIAMGRLHFDFLGSYQWVTVLVCLALLAAVWYYYRRTTPPLPKFLRILLLVLRSIALAALCFVLLQPAVSVTSQSLDKKSMAVLVDHSLSMKTPITPGSETTRLDMADDILDSDAMAPLYDSLDMTIYAFAESLDVTEKGLNLSGYQSNPDRALERLKELRAIDPPDYIMILSDGRITEGGDLPDAADAFGRPVYTVAIGDSTETHDLALTDVEYDAILFAGRKTEIKAIVSQRGEVGDRMTITLKDGNTVLAQKSADTPGDGRIADQTISFTPAAPGRMFLTLQVTSGDETDTDNNRKTFAVRVLKSKLNVLLYSSSLNQEYAFLKRYLSGRDDYEVTTVIDAPGGDRLGGRFPTSQEGLNSFDLVVLIDPDLGRLSSYYDIMMSYMVDRGGGIMILMGEKYARSAAGNRIESLSPLAVSPIAGQQITYGKFHIEPNLRMVFHPVMKLADTREEITALWNNQPPFTQYVPVDSTRSGSIALGYLASDLETAKKTVAAYKRYGGGKVLAFAVAPFWHWAFYPVGVGGKVAVYEDLMAGTIRWLTISDESDRVNFKPVKEVFQHGESIAFEGTIRDEGFRPIIGGSGDVTVVSANDDTTIARILPQTQKGDYSADAGVLPPGKYDYHAEVFADSVRLGEFEGEFTVSDINRETAFSDVDWSSMAAAAKNTGGVFASYKDIKPIIDAIDMTQTRVVEKNDYRLWDNIVLLIIILGALAIEWFIRKRRQLL